MKLTGKSRAILKHSDGRIEISENHNLILDVGFDFVISKIISADASAPMTYVAVGTGTTAASSTLTSLTTEVARTQGTWTWTSGQASRTFTISATFAQGAVIGTITEAGVCNASTSGTFLDRVLYDTALIGTSDSTLTIEFEFGVV